ncbi:MAG: EF-P lysine aminoacylase EpmA [Gammaproteobacteria bacterium]
MDWRPGATREILHQRARLYAEIRTFFAARGVLEVETPLLASATATDLHLASCVVGPAGNPAGRGDAPLFLQTSPEFAMKRLLAAGSGPVYQLCKAFRAGDDGVRHNPEFTLLEWYRPGFALWQLMDEVEALLVATLGGALAFASCGRTTYRALFVDRFGINPHSADIGELRAAVARETSYGNASDLDASACLDLLFSTGIEPSLGHECPLFVSGFPVPQAALARVGENEHGDAVASRCEVYVRGMELANAYDELTDAQEQHRRFTADNRARRSRGLPEIPVDERLLAALVHGLPDCSGIALGIDRLLMLRTGCATIDEVLAFSARRC